MRNSSIETLRFLLMVMIFTWHLIMHGNSFAHIPDGLYTGYIYSDIILLAICSCAVDCFIFISGFYGIQFKVKKLSVLIISSWLTSIICTIAVTYLGNKLSLFGVISVLFPLSYSRWWFMTFFIILYLLSPLLNTITEGLTRKQGRVLLSTLIVYDCISFTRIGVMLGNNIILMITIYLIGRYCNKYKANIRFSYSVFFYVASVILMLGIMYILVSLSKEKYIYLWLLNYNNPLIILMAASLFYMFKSFVFRNKVVNHIFSSCLFIYLITDYPTIAADLDKYIVVLFKDNITIGLLASIGVIAFCLMFGYVINYIAKCLVNNIEGLINSHTYRQMKQD